MKRFKFGLMVLGFLGKFHGAEANNLKIHSGLPIEIFADQLVHDKKLGLIIAKGHVYVLQGAQQIKANTITYNQKLDLVTASGFVEVTDEKGDKAYAPYVELSAGMKEGFIREIKILTSENTRFSAQKGQRHGHLSVLEKVLYTPCKACKNSSTPFTWHIKAKNVILDDQDQEVRFRNAILYMGRIPVFYIPYFSQPSPAVDRKQGFLRPTIRVNPTLGGYVSIPYYIPFGTQSDLVIEPYFFTKELPLGSFLYRHQYHKGRIQFQGGMIKPDHVRSIKLISTTPKSNDSYMAYSNRPRWHTQFNGDYHLNEYWRLSTSINRISDKMYYRHYPFFGYTQSANLESKLAAEGFYGQQYTNLRGYVFQNLDQNASVKDSPILLPLAQVFLTSSPGRLKEVWTLNLQGRSIYRQEGLNSQTFVVKGGIDIPVTTDTGQIWNFKATLQSNIYYTYIQETKRQQSFFKAQGKQTVFPKASVEWRYPLVTYHKGLTWIIQPLVMVVGSPLVHQKQGIPNEDCRDFEYDDTALFLPDRFNGFDRLDKGSRVDYGVQTILKKKGWSSIFLGQSYSMNNRSFFLEGSGLEYKNSDYVVRSIAAPSQWLTFNYRGRFHKRKMQLRWNEMGVTLGQKDFFISTNYLFMDKHTIPLFKGKYHLISPGMEARFAKYWSANVSMTRDLNKKRQLVQGAHLAYKDDCFELTGGLYRSFYKIPGIRPGLNYMVRVNLKTLGEYTYRSTLNRNPRSPLGDENTSVPSSKN